MLRRTYRMRYVRTRIGDLLAPSPLDAWWQDLSQVEHPTVIERLHWTQDIYADFGAATRLSEMDHWLLEGWLIAHGGQIIRTNPPTEVVRSNVWKRGRASTTFIENVADEFERPWSTELPISTYDYIMDPDARDFEIDWKLALDFNHRGIGSAKPRYTFVMPMGDPWFPWRNEFADATYKMFERLGLDWGRVHVMDTSVLDDLVDSWNGRSRTFIIHDPKELERLIP